MSATEVEPHTTVQFEATLKLWGFAFKRDARKSHIFTIPSTFVKKNIHGVTVREFAVTKGRTYNHYQLQEVCNMINVTPEDFWAGPILITSETPIVEFKPEPVNSAKEGRKNGSVPINKGKAINASRIMIIQFLGSQPDCMVTDSNGFASNKIREFMVAHGHPLAPQGVSNILRAMSEDNQLIRQIRGKRTYSILLNTDDEFVIDTLAAAPVPEPQVEATPPVELDEEPVNRYGEVEPEPENPLAWKSEQIDNPLPVQHIDYDLLAERVVERLAYLLFRPAREAQLHSEVDDLKERLHRATEYSQSLRRQLERYTS